ncbi:MAG TPA: NAD-glutamate dehydrogenase [Gammaproteobacteria bacterium]|nr:NAD-glutamate dehydrogenase [Gammaproteobacteria bacterium]
MDETSTAAEPFQSERIKAIAAYGRRLEPHPSLEIDADRYLAHYYAQVPPEDLARSPAELAASALDHLEFARTRRTGTAKILAFNPTLEQHGWTSPHTVVQFVNDDMPFLVDSITLGLNALGHGVLLTIHPIFSVRRSARGVLEKMYFSTPPPEARRESFIHVEIARTTDPAALREIETELAKGLRDVRCAVEDWKAMTEKLGEASAELRASIGPPRELAAESADFLDWLADDHFTLLGYHEFSLVRGARADALEPVPDTGLGILRDRNRMIEPMTLVGPARAEARSSRPLVVTKSGMQSRVHRRAPLDYISVKVFDRRGRPVRERRFLGLFTSSAYNELPRDIPLLRLKARQLVEQAGVDPNSHRGKMLQHVVDTFPRDDLFQASLEELERIVNGILGLQERRRVRLFCRRDPFGRFYACLVYLPRDQYNRRARERIEQILLHGFGGTAVESDVMVSDSALARLTVKVKSDPSAPDADNVDELERELGEAVRTWPDRLREALLASFSEDRALALFRRFADHFSAAYQEEVSPERGAEDILKVERLADGETALEMRIFQAQPGTPRFRFSTFKPREPIPLYVALPILENMGLKVHREGIYSVRLGEDTVWIQDFDVTVSSGQPVDAAAIEERFEECFSRVFRGRIDNDAFNAFVVGAGLDWREAALLRAYCRYLLQTGMRFSQSYMQEVLGRYPALCRALVLRFKALFDPDRAAGAREQEAEEHAAAIRAEIELTSSLDEDRILRAFAGAVEATVRTNFFQLAGAAPKAGGSPKPIPNGEPKPYLSLKLDCATIPELPRPRPKFEVFVHSQRVEAVHLRASRIARGGIRWSDRREDFRMEVLGLMKAQQVKNSVIVPNGAKGGFVCKQLPAGDRDAVQREVVDCYTTFMRGLLDVTDNIVDGRVVRPARVVARDSDDPYLVVAADKGTASFSDIANGIAREYGFWLGDAFASGGSAGYDHKKMGITARGVWEGVKRHFRELGVDVQSQDFTVAGIGDMSGDVFGNGMLQSEHIRLVAAFNHEHIFIDPDPDAAASFLERKRLFELPRSTWDDYDRKKLSAGGGIYSRRGKSIELSSEACALLGLERATVTPPELIRAVLRAKVDLLYNGGIGTYVKSSDEDHADARDPANDAVRVDGRDLRCRVVGEGGNLGFTQRGRIEYARAGGRINTDFIDNSGGVDTSDREVNIKILLNDALEAGALRPSRRIALLESMTDEIAAQVLADNYGQTQALSVASSRESDRLGEQARLIRVLEAQGHLDRDLEFLPSDEELEERRRAGLGLTRPELAVVLSYAKIALTGSLIKTDIPDDPFLAKELELYFPRTLQRRYKAFMYSHRLRREIVSMLISSSMINRMGPYFPFRAQDETGAGVAQVARAYAVVREVFGIRALWRKIEALDYRIRAQLQYDVMFEISRRVRHAVYWFLQRYPADLEVEPMIERFRPGIARVLGAPPALGARGDRRFDDDARRLEEVGLPASLAREVAALTTITQVLDIVELAEERELDARRLARLYFEVGRKLRLDWIRDEIENLKVQGHWSAMARSTLRETLAREHRAVVEGIVERRGHADLDAALAAWVAEMSGGIARVSKVLGEMQAAGPMDFATLSIALKEVNRLA